MVDVASAQSSLEIARQWTTLFGLELIDYTALQAALRKRKPPVWPEEQRQRLSAKHLLEYQDGQGWIPTELGRRLVPLITLVLKTELEQRRLPSLQNALDKVSPSSA